MSAPVGHFRDLIQALEAGPMVPDDVARWLHDGCVRFATGDTRTLDAALGLTGQGINVPISVYARQARDMELMAAYELIEGRSQRIRCTELGRQIAAFECRTWRRVQAEREAPARLTPVQACLFRAFKLDPKVPSSRSQLTEIVRRNAPVS